MRDLRDYFAGQAIAAICAGNAPSKEKMRSAAKAAYLMADMMLEARNDVVSFGLRQAAQEVGVSKSTILRAIQNGRLSAARTPDGGYSISRNDLFEVYQKKRRDAEVARALGQILGEALNA